jgi:hypothetical protein
MGRRRIDARGLALRPSRIWWPRDTDRRADRRKVGINVEDRRGIVPASQYGPTRQFLAGQGNSQPGFSVSVMTCWEHK